MKNIAKVIWSAEAVENLEKIIQYLQEHWTEQEIKKFVKKLLLVLMILLKMTICWSQTDSTFLIFENEEENLQSISFKTNNECYIKNILLVDVDVTHCDSIDNKEILPSKSQKIYLRSRIIDFKRNKDSLAVTLIGFSDCCASFYAELKCFNDTTLNLQYFDVGELECFCGGCPYLFTYKIIDKEQRIKAVLLNGNEIEFTDKIYRNENVIRKRSFISGKTIVKTYSDSHLVLERHYNRQGELLLTKMFYLGEEIKK
jgi:hypothetical protein